MLDERPRSRANSWMTRAVEEKAAGPQWPRIGPRPGKPTLCERLHQVGRNRMARGIGGDVREGSIRPRSRSALPAQNRSPARRFQCGTSETAVHAICPGVASARRRLRRVWRRAQPGPLPDCMAGNESGERQAPCAAPTTSTGGDSLEGVPDQPEARRPQTDEQRAPLGVAPLVLVDGLGPDPQRDAQPDRAQGE